jgi:hypothetical protein
MARKEELEATAEPPESLQLQDASALEPFRQGGEHTRCHQRHTEICALFMFISLLGI